MDGWMGILLQGKEKRSFKNRFVKRVKTPVVIQMEASECGAASLAIMLGYYGKFVPLEELRIACGVSRNGSKANHIVRAARQYGLVARGFRYEPEELKSITLPAIIHWKFNHFLVLEGFGKGFVYLNDPASGPYRVTEEEFDQGYTGVTLLFKPGEEFKKSGVKRNIFSSLKNSLQGLATPLTFLLLLSFLLIFPGVVLPVFSRLFVDDILKGVRGWFLPLILGMALTAIFRTAVTAIRQRYLLRLKTAISFTFSRRFMEHLLHLPMEFFMQRFAGDIGSRVAYNDEVSEIITGELASTVLDLVMACFFLVVMLIYDPLLALLGAGIAMVNLVFWVNIFDLQKTQQRRLVTDMGKLEGTAASGLETIETLKANGTESDFFARWAGYQAKLLNTEQRLGMTMQLLLAIPVIITSIDSIAILALGSWKVMNGQMTLGSLVAFQSLLSSFIGPISNLLGFGSRVQSLDILLSRLDDVYDYPARVKGQWEPAGKDEKLTGQVELKHVTFGYCRLDPPLIEDFSLMMEPGTHVAIVGGSGSGKSTVSRLVANLYEPWSGEILFDGKPRRCISPEVFSRSFSMVDQDISIFEGSVRENITLWNQEIPEESMLRATRDACVYDVIQARDEGFDLVIDENGRCFSGGEKQRIEIARALAIDPVIVVLDEATSALDPVIEKEVMDNVRKRGCSCLIVAHRLSTIMDCDEIIVLDKGKVQEQGTHEELIKLGGHYVRLVQSNG